MIKEYTLVNKVYEEYCIAWKNKNGVNTKVINDTMQKYHDMKMDNNMSFETYCHQFGYVNCGKCFSKREDFLMNEFQDRNYIKSILNAATFKQYNKYEDLVQLARDGMYLD